ncbi:hypothetical protein BAURA86_03226 [Brevibacterium aurantiacum]|uniref:Uncharacterized protein n=1 Tax=Brevibacterium aurantiacum TaxID=273384 RepID=A0A2H1KSK4_BREAU|nr:hypothetical protein CIK60_00030 [Brevibacterium aurantiacum]SMY02720.1 hypothetical protein BAURA86_03226 [Brevibacterium aurantiacum]
MRMAESNFDYRAISHLEAGDIVAALREWVECVVDDEDQGRVEKLLRRCESSLDIVLVSRTSSIASERGTSFEGGPRRAGASDLNA